MHSTDRMDKCIPVSLFTDFDIELFMSGNHYRLYEKMGAHPYEYNGVKGICFAVWAPNASSVSVVGNFNYWQRDEYTLYPRWDGSGIWEGFIPDLNTGEIYKYFIRSNSGYEVEKADPYAFRAETPPATASVVEGLDYKWTDKKWMTARAKGKLDSKPVSVYEMHIGSWRRNADGSYLTYRQLAEELPGYCKYMGFTHVEFLPVMEHPFYGSWGYQITGYYAPSSRYGSATDFMALVDALHNAGVGVILDWVPSHFPTDEHGLGYFDGTHLFEHDDPRKGFHPDWKSFIFNFNRNEVRAFLISNALYWLDKYHIDGLRVDAVASMLYLDYSRNAGEWLPNEYGGRESLEAIRFLKDFNDAVHKYYPDVFTVAEESTSWEGVTRSTEHGGLGFDLKWMMGWMHDTLQYFSKDPIYRGYHQGQLAFSIHYAFFEKFMLPLSHDEVVYGKRSLIEKMPGDPWQRFANLRLLFSYMYMHPGSKLLFMGSEFAQQHEWRHDYSLDWHEANGQMNRGVQLLLKDLNELYNTEKDLHQYNYSYEGFQWIDHNDSANCVLAWMRKSDEDNKAILVIANFTPMPRHNYRIGVPLRGTYQEIFNSDDVKYSGSGVNNTSLSTAPIPKHYQMHSLALTLPPLGLIALKYTGDI